MRSSPVRYIQCEAQFGRVTSFDAITLDILVQISRVASPCDRDLRVSPQCALVESTCINVTALLQRDCTALGAICSVLPKGDTD